MVVKVNVKIGKMSMHN